jgi:hypothetical protein
MPYWRQHSRAGTFKLRHELRMRKVKTKAVPHLALVCISNILEFSVVIGRTILAPPLLAFSIAFAVVRNHNTCLGYKR